MLEYREKMMKDQEFKKEQDKLMNKPLPKLKWFKIPKPEHEGKPYLCRDHQE